ncbi:hypothetical protein D3C73_1516930 [compost metagenome]
MKNSLFAAPLQAQFAGTRQQHRTEFGGAIDGLAEGAAAEQATAHQVHFLLAHRWMALTLGHLGFQLFDGLAKQLHEAVGRERPVSSALARTRQAIALQFIK